jgi:hypothetical protein
MTENDYIAEYVRERHPGILGIDYAAWRLARAVFEFGISMREAISRISAGELQRMMEEEQEDEESEA